MFKVIFSFVFLATLSGCGFKGCESSNKKTAYVVAEVGQFEITKQMILDRDQIIRLSYPNEQRSMGLLQLKKAYTDAQILINNGHKITDDILQKEIKRIDKNTKAPEKLKQLKDIFKDREDDYIKTFILPTYARRTIYYDFFLNDEKVQAESLAQANDLYEKVLENPKSWAQNIKDKNIKTLKAKVSLSEGFKLLPDENNPQNRIVSKGKGIIDQSPQKVEAAKVKAQLELDQKKQVSEVGKKWIEELIKPIKPGEVIQKIINQGEMGWLVVRYKGPDQSLKDSYDLDVAIFPKRNYSKWHSEEAAKIK